MEHFLLWRSQAFENLATIRYDVRYLELAIADMERRAICRDKQSNQSCCLLNLALGKNCESIDGFTDTWPSPDKKAQAYVATGNLNGAISVLTKAMENDAKQTIEQVMSFLAYRGHVFDLAGDPGRRDRDWNQLRENAERKRPECPWAIVMESHLQAANYDHVLTQVDSHDEALEMSRCEVLKLRSRALRGLANQKFDHILAEQELDCWREAIVIDSQFLIGWQSLFARLLGQWRYDEAIDLAKKRPQQDCTETVRSGCLVDKFSLHEYLDSSIPYWHARASFLSGNHNDAIDRYSQMPWLDKNMMEKAMAHGAIGNVTQMEQTLDKLVNREIA